MSYQLEQSPLYRLNRKKGLAELLNVSNKDLKHFLSDVNYKEWTQRKPGKKERLIEEPKPELALLLKRLNGLLARIETPNWLYSGKPSIRPKDNAILHKDNTYLINVDLHAFYQSVRYEYVASCFERIFRQSNDVAELLARLVTYKGHLPTGASTSQLVAFWAYRPMFERIHGLCQAHELDMSLWVDDITFGAKKPFPDGWLKDIRQIVRHVNLTLSASKTRKYGPDEFKVVTGTAISKDGVLFVKNKKRKEILDLIDGRSVESLSLKEARSLQGKLIAQRLQEPSLFEEILQRCKRRLRHISQEHER